MVIGRLVLVAALGSVLAVAASGGGGLLDGFAIRHVPVRAGEEVSDFRYEWEDVRFVSRVWETSRENVTQVNLKVAILRGPRLTSLAALREFLAAYHEQDPTTWPLNHFQNGRYHGYINDSEAFWLTTPGVAVTIRTPSSALTPSDLRTTALSIQPVVLPPTHP
ncbi:hypothetical protein Aph01nite_52720 [Acrocarpospora phusangensis]|uniref:Uncharacterized protein n=1 Tax=Acrocarpospora phusangensis TaxID=1070424 RepID=A0A919QDI9_9ACTN|nr:hypothetical protein [Acrocarpospora phusangensis]GIH26962.1 hypothetical protein Aph01nite_52720 [Acrocarpospora phusangensis]